MHYEIYIDSLFLLNLGMNLYLLELTNCILHDTATWKRIVLGALCGSIFSIIPFLLPGKLIVVIGVGFLLDVFCMSVIVFRTTGFSAYLKVLEVLSILTIVIGALLQYVMNRIQEKLQLPLLALLLGGAVCFLVIRRLLYRNPQSYECKVVLQNGKAKVKINALVDTGNSLIEPISGSPVAVLDKSVFESLFLGDKPGGFRVIPYHSIDKKAGLLPGYLIPEMQIEWKGFCREYHNVYVGIRQEHMWLGENYKMIINPEMMKERKTE